MSEAKTFMRAEIYGLGGNDIEVRVRDSANVWVDVALDEHGLRQLDTLIKGLLGLRGRFPTDLLAGGE